MLMRKKTVDDTYKKRGRWKNRERLPFIYERECVRERGSNLWQHISPLSWGNRQAAILWFHQYFWQDRDCNLVSILSIGINSCKNDGSSVWCLNFLTPSQFFQMTLNIHVIKTCQYAKTIRSANGIILVEYKTILHSMPFSVLKFAMTVYRVRTWWHTFSIMYKLHSD